MATYKTLKTRIKQKYDTLENWVNENPVLLKGELAVVEVPTGDTSGAATTPPAIMFKIGDGASKFNDLDWVSAKAADVYAWAKESSITVTEKGKGSYISDITWDETANDGKGGLVITKGYPPTGDNQRIAAVNYTTGETVQFSDAVVVSLKGEFTQSTGGKLGIAVYPDNSANTITLKLNDETQSEIGSAYSHSRKTTGNPHNVTAADVGLGNVANTGDSALPLKGGTTKFTTGGAFNLKEELIEKIEGKTKGYVISVTGAATTYLNTLLNWDITSNIKSKDIPYSATAYFLLADGSTLASGDLKVGDTIYTAEINIKDWFVGSINTTTNYVTMFPISADSPDLQTYVNKVTTAEGSGDKNVYISAISKTNDSSGATLTATQSSFGSFTVAGTTYSPGSGDKTLAVTDGAPTLAWGATSTVGTVGNTSFTVKMPSNPDTHWQSAMYAGGSDSPASESVRNPYLKLFDGAKYTAPVSKIQFVGAGLTQVSSSADNKITITTTSDNSWRPIYVNEDMFLSKNTSSGNLKFVDSDYVKFEVDKEKAAVKATAGSKMIDTDSYVLIDCGSASEVIF